MRLNALEPFISSYFTEQLIWTFLFHSSCIRLTPMEHSQIT